MNYKLLYRHLSTFFNFDCLPLLKFVEEFNLAELNQSFTSRVTEIELQLLSAEPDF